MFFVEVVFFLSYLHQSLNPGDGLDQFQFVCVFSFPYSDDGELLHLREGRLRHSKCLLLCIFLPTLLHPNSYFFFVFQIFFHLPVNGRQPVLL